MKRIQLVLVFVVGMYLSSCTLYKSTSINSPLLNEKGDAQLKASTLSSLELSAVYALTNQLAVLVDAGSANTYLVRYEVEENEFKNSWLLNYKFDAGLGLYNSAKNKSGFQVFAGYSYGRAGTFENSILKGGTNSVLNTRLKGPYLQASYRFTLKENTFLNFLGKGKYYRFYDFENLGEFDLGGMQEGDDFYIQQFGVELKEIREKVTTNFQILYSDYYGAANAFSLRALSVHFGVAYRFQKKN